MELCSQAELYTAAVIQSEVPNPSLSAMHFLSIAGALLCALFSTAYAKDGRPAPTEKIVVLITGCSSGIGRQLSLAFAGHSSARFRVYATMRDVSKWESDGDTSYDNLFIERLDVTSESDCHDAVASILSREKRIDILVNNAGYGMAGYLESVEVDEAKDLFDVNVWGAVRMAQAVLPSMRRSSWGHIINISSTSGVRGIPTLEIYTGSKFALEGIMDSLRYGVANFNISITNVNAGPIRTKFTDRFGVSSAGGRGTRSIVDDEQGYLSALTQTYIDALNARMASAEAQSAAEASSVIINLALLKQSSSSITEVPFNFGTNHFSQELLESVKKQPTGWGSIYTSILSSLPPLKPASARTDL